MPVTLGVKELRQEGNKQRPASATLQDQSQNYIVTLPVTLASDSRIGTKLSDTICFIFNSALFTERTVDVRLYTLL